ncbi:ZinT/AdcA family metal-binding protein [Peptoniphilus indolicus]|uniref:Zinc-binding lipoprotein n=2 Tax=Peptoniphilus indolicus TaxID=33030 RepID=G4D632_9FIRM|nr:ZinT/AdcA family metal-binding protein [Peptoniphilus indolicus]EGY77460.1 zinc-binding lipoprotein [Peptoniphilus indolicus ATCC 29427]SUB74539.1 zinc/cadmium-binding protein [Peptoniphilus indolicus]
MKNLKMLAVTTAMCMSMLVVGCQKKEAPANNAPTNAAVQNANMDKDAKAKTADAKVTLADWEGTWNNFGAYLDDPAVQPAFEEVAKRDGITAEEAKAKLLERRNCEFNGMVVKGDTITFLDGFEDKGGKEVASAEYKLTDEHKTQHGSHELTWYTFESEGAKYPVLLLMEVHGEEELTHFHMRYGNNAEELLAMDDWFPTFVKPNSTMDQIIEEITE